MNDDWESLIGCELPFYGCEGYKFRLSGITWEAIRDEDDGYRSRLGSIERDGGEFADIVSLVRECDNSIPPLAIVKVERIEKIYPYRMDSYQKIDSGYRLVDVADSHVWLVTGTDNEDDYYPCFVFNYTPKGV